MKKLKYLLPFLIISTNLFSQKLDSLVTNEGVLLVNIIEITPDEIKFKYPNEDILNTVSKNTVSNISLKSGRKINFSNNYKKIIGGKDWQSVLIAQMESEVKGLYKVGEFNISTANKSNGIEHLKMQSALLGGNVFYVASQSNSNDFFSLPMIYSFFGSTTNYELNGYVYSNLKLNCNNFSKIINEKEFKIIKKEELSIRDSYIEDKNFAKQKVVFEKFECVNNDIIIQSKIPKLAKSEIFKVTYFDEKIIILMWKDNQRIINYTLSPF